MTLAADARKIAQAGIRAVERARLLPRALVRTARGIRFPNGERIPLLPGRPLPVVALGKAALGLARAARRTLGSDVEGIVVAPPGSRGPPPGFALHTGHHPVPDGTSLRAARAVFDFLDRHRGEPLLVLLSGGGSALCEAPASDLTVQELARTTELLLASRAPIQAMNAIRRHLSAVKGGGLALRRAGDRTITLAISDVVGDTPEDIASGPTVADPSTFADAAAAARRYGLWNDLPSAVRWHLVEGRGGSRPETPKPGDPRLAGSTFCLVGSNRVALEAAALEARRLGYPPRLLSSRLTGDTETVGRAHGELLRTVATRGEPFRPPICLLSGGETTIELGSHPGHGGRNQQFALAAALALDGVPGALLLSVGTDGVDGPTDAAGGWADGTTVARARKRGLDLVGALAAHESYYTLRRLGSLWRTGPTGTNVADLHVGLAVPATPRYGRK